MKAIISVPTNSIAIIFDAINNSSDTLLSTITIVSTKLAHLSPDKKHPLGYGRIEYLTASAVSMIVLYAGITSLIDSIQTITAPEAPSYTTVSLTLTAVTISVKIFLDRFVKATSEKVGSDALAASGSDALFDATLSISTLATAFIYIAFGTSLEA
jgi:cation diffusion facilitator family transporter